VTWGDATRATTERGCHEQPDGGQCEHAAHTAWTSEAGVLDAQPGPSHGSNVPSDPDPRVAVAAR
jgi:hypothetical protein